MSNTPEMKDLGSRASVIVTRPPNPHSSPESMSFAPTPSIWRTTPRVSNIWPLKPNNDEAKIRVATARAKAREAEMRARWVQPRFQQEVQHRGREKLQLVEESPRRMVKTPSTSPKVPSFLSLTFTQTIKIASPYIPILYATASTWLKMTCVWVEKMRDRSIELVWKPLGEWLIEV